MTSPIKTQITGQDFANSTLVAENGDSQDGFKMLSL